MENTLIRHAAIVLFCMTSISCSPTISDALIGYPIESSSTVYFHSIGLELSRVSVDGTEQGMFDNGIRVLPGARSIEASFRVMNEDHCKSNAAFCFYSISGGECLGEAIMFPGVEYVVKIRAVGEEAVGEVFEKKGDVPVGRVACIVQDYDYSFGEKTL